MNMKTDDFVKLARKLRQLTHGEYRVAFDVQMNGRTGRIFWYTLTSGSEVSEVDLFAERVLGKLLFEENPEGLVTEGQIEIILDLY